MMRPLFPIHWLLITLMLAAIMFLTADAAFAGEAGNFSCVGSTATGTLYNSNILCPTTLSSDNIFSFLVCNMEQLSSNLLGQMFCGMVTGLTPAVKAVLVLATLFFGIGFAIGVIPATAREFQIFLLKVAAVWAFATQSEYLLDVGYRLLINGVRDGVAIALTGYGKAGATTQPLVYSQLDGFLAQMIRFATDYVGSDPSTAAGGCNNALFAVMAVMAIAFPPIFFLGIALVMRIGITFLRAIFGYIYALVGIAFLLTLAPFFLSFYLFRQTRPFFEKWVGYLISFALQIVILFAFLAFILSVNNAERYTDSNLNGKYDGPEAYTDLNGDGSWTDASGSTPAEPFVDSNGDSKYTATGEQFDDFSPPNGKRDSGIGTDITELVMPTAQVKEGGSFRMPWDYCTVCEFEVYTPTGGGNKGPAIPQSQYSSALRTGKMRCIDYRDNKYPAPKPTNMDPNTGRVPITLDTSASPNQKKQNALIQFAGAGLMALLVMAYILESLLAYVASLAQTLASGFGGATYAPQLGGGSNTAQRPTVGMPGDNLYRDFEAGMDRGFAANKTDKQGKPTGRDSVSRTVEGVRGGLARMVSGDVYRYERDDHGNETGSPMIDRDGKRVVTNDADSGGIKNRFLDWLVDPSHINRD